MFHRLVKFPDSYSFFLFGPRGTGKTFLLKDRFIGQSGVLYIDLLQPSEMETFTLNSRELTQRIEGHRNLRWVLIDEIQKIPKLLDLVHQQIESTSLYFVLTGSSARKLKRGAANLLAGRAFVYHLFPLTHREIGSDFSLEQVLSWGSLPKIFDFNNDAERFEYLKSYTHTYLQEEIVAEQLIRKVEPFMRFLSVAAQMNGQDINYSKIAQQIGVSSPTVQTYFQILEDTMVGTLLSPFNESIRKQQAGNPKFYFFDLGVQRSLSNTLSIPLTPQTYAFGKAFEHFVINEVIRLVSYNRKEFSFSYLRTKSGIEIDLIMERPGMKRALIEIKSTTLVTERDTKALCHLQKDIPNSEAFIFSLDPNPKKIAEVSCLPWQNGLEEVGL